MLTIIAQARHLKAEALVMSSGMLRRDISCRFIIIIIINSFTNFTEVFN